MTDSEMQMSEVIEGTIAEHCPAEAESCRCRREPGHEMPHACPCGAQWNGDIDGEDFEAVRLPPPVVVPGLGYEEKW